MLYFVFSGNLENGCFIFCLFAKPLVELRFDCAMVVLVISQGVCVRVYVCVCVPACVVRVLICQCVCVLTMALCDVYILFLGTW